MESAQSTLEPRIPHINYVVYTTVEGIKQIGEDWWVHFTGSRESMQFGKSKPFEINDRVRITFEKVRDALPSQPSI